METQTLTVWTVATEPARVPAPARRYRNRSRPAGVYMLSDVLSRAKALALAIQAPAGRAALMAFSVAIAGAEVLTRRDLADVLNSLAPCDMRRPDAIAWQLALDRLALALGLDICEV